MAVGGCQPVLATVGFCWSSLACIMKAIIDLCWPALAQWTLIYNISIVNK